jgi:hypothetical protein
MWNYRERIPMALREKATIISNIPKRFNFRWLLPPS